MRLLIQDTTAYIGNRFDRKDHIDIFIDNGKIIAIDQNLLVDGAELIDGKDFFVTPGFVNGHFHPTQQFNRALGVGFSHDQQMDLLHATDQIKKPEDSYWSSCIAILEGLKAGTTCFYSVGSSIETMLEAYNNMGIRAACTLIPKDIVAVEKDQSVRAQTWFTQERLDKAESLYKNYHSDLVRVHFGAVNVRYASDDLILGMLDLANKYNVGYHMHAAESIEYVESVLKRTGHREVEHLFKIGALNERVSIAHAVQLEPFEIDFLSSSKAHVIHCPRSNSYVGVGICPVKELLDAGVNIALGSDAAINNNSNEVRSEARAAHDKIADKYNKANILDYITLFQMLTINGARAMGLESVIGTIENGKQADLVLWSKDDLPFIPGFNHIADLIFTDSCRAHTVLINGERVLHNYVATKVNEEELKRRARDIADNYLAAFEELRSKTHL